MEKSHFIRVNGELVPVSQEVYKAYYSSRRQELTQRERDTRHGLISYDAWDNKNSTGVDALTSPAPSPEESVVYKLTSVKLARCLALLTNEERELIHSLFYSGETLAALARRLDVPRKTLEGRRDKLLRRLRVHMEAPDRE